MNTLKCCNTVTIVKQGKQAPLLSLIINTRCCLNNVDIFPEYTVLGLQLTVIVIIVQSVLLFFQ